MKGKHNYENNFYLIRSTSSYLGFKNRESLYETPEKTERELYRMIFFKKNIKEYPNNWSSKKIKLTEYNNEFKTIQKVKS